jgi:hypothetical protein
LAGRDEAFINGWDVFLGAAEVSCGADFTDAGFAAGFAFVDTVPTDVCFVAVDGVRLTVDAVFDD